MPSRLCTRGDAFIRSRKGWYKLALSSCSAAILAACGGGSAVDGPTAEPDGSLRKALSLVDLSTPTAVPRANCGPGSLPETGLQGQVPLADRQSGRSQQGYSCNLERIGHYQGEGATWVNPFYRNCAYMGTSFSGIATKKSQGVQVVDLTQYCSFRLKLPIIVFVATRRRVGAWHEPRRCWGPGPG